MSRWLGILRWSPAPAPLDGDVAREAIRLLREAELDFRRAGQQSLSHHYGSRATLLERKLAPRRP